MYHLHCSASGRLAHVRKQAVCRQVGAAAVIHSVQSSVHAHLIQKMSRTNTPIVISLPTSPLGLMTCIHEQDPQQKEDMDDVLEQLTCS